MLAKSGVGGGRRDGKKEDRSILESLALNKRTEKG